MSLTETQQALHEAMSNASEFAYFAGWMEGTEYRLWAFMMNAEDSGEWGLATLPQTLKAELRTLSERAGGWIYFRCGDNIPIEEWGPAFVETAEWMLRYDVN